MDKTSAHSNGDVEFIGFQETIAGDTFPLFNITAANHPLRGSTVTENTLNDLNLQVPDQYKANNTGNLSDTQGKEKN